MGKKPGPKPRPMNLNDLIKQRALHAAPPTAEDIQALLVSLLYDTPADEIALATMTPRGRLKLDILMSLHKINVDQRPPDSKGGDQDAQLLSILAARQQRKIQDAAQQEAKGPDPDPE